MNLKTLLKMPKYFFIHVLINNLYVRFIVNTYISVNYLSEKGRYTFIYYWNINSTVVIILNY